MWVPLPPILFKGVLLQSISNFQLCDGETGKVKQMFTTTNLMSEKNEITFQIILKNVIR